jgi:arylsulfatase A-like enzyme
VKRITGLAVGFEAWSEPEGEVRPGAEALADALAWLDQVNEPFFLWIHLFDAHSPPREKNVAHIKELGVDDALKAHMAAIHVGAAARGGARGGGAGAAATAAGGRVFVQYDAGIRIMDDHVGALIAKLKARGAWDHTTVVVAGDHGEGLGQHGVMTHGPVWNEALHVPFFVRVPGRAPAKIASVVSGIDVLATVLDLSPGLPKDEFMQQAHGRSAVAADFEERPVFSMSPPRRGEFSLTTARWKYIHREKGIHELFDLENDPYELKDVAREHPEIAKSLESQVTAAIAHQKQRRAYYALGMEMKDLTPEQKKKLQAELEALGYADDGDK